MRNSTNSKPSRSPDGDIVTTQDFSVRLGWLIIEAQAGGLLIGDQITVLQCALDVARGLFAMMIEIEAPGDKGAAGVVLGDPGQVRAERRPGPCRGAVGVAEEMRSRRFAAEMEALRRPYPDDSWPWVMVVITVVTGSIIVAAIRLPEILHAF